jgi:predicted transposase/invertase (TIGR01784 family)
LNKDTGQHDLKDLEFNFIELPKFTKSESELETVAEKWIYFLQHADDLDRVPENANTPALQEAYEVAAQHTWTAEELDIYEAQEFKIAVDANVLKTALMDGMNKGIEQGKESKALEIANNLLSLMDDSAIAHITGLDIQTIQTLRAE